MGGRRVAVTGIGVVAPCGLGQEAFWAGLNAPVANEDRRIVDFDPLPFFANPKEARRADRFAQMALAAAAEALEQAGPLDADPIRTGVMVGSGVGGIGTLEDQIWTFHDKGPRRVSPFLVPMMMSNAAAASVSMKYGFQGPCETTVTACAAGTHSLTNAAHLIADNRCDAMIAGGSEAAMTPVGTQGFANMTALSSVGRSRPFDKERDGFMIAEGAGVFVLEEMESAKARGATILGEILGGASTADAHHITAPAPGGAGAIACMELALADAGIGAADVRHINAHGTSTPLNDAAEAGAIDKLFGSPGPIVTSTKGVTGHALGAAGAIEAAAVLLSMQHRLIPPTVGTEAVDPELAQIDLVLGASREWEPGPSISNSFGFGGHNGTLVLAPAS